jgi:hypothetical protein
VPRNSGSEEWFPPSSEGNEIANFAFVTWDGGGNVGPAIGIAQALAARGHRSHFFGYARQAGRFEAAGLPFSTLGRNGDFDMHAVPPQQRLAALLRHVWACPERLHDLPAAMDEFPADLMLVDFLMQGALAFAPRSAIPVAALIHSAIAGLVPPPQSPVGALRLTAVNDLRVAAGLPSIGRLNDAWDRLLALVTTVAALDPAATEAGPSVHYVGPIVSGGRDDGRSIQGSGQEGRVLLAPRLRRDSGASQALRRRRGLGLAPMTRAANVRIVARLSGDADSPRRARLFGGQNTNEAPASAPGRSGHGVNTGRRAPESLTARRP